MPKRPQRARRSRAKIASMVWPGQHVGEEPDRQGEGPDAIGQQLDRHQQQQQHHRHAVRHEQAEEMPAVRGDADDGDADEHRRRQREGDDDVAGEGEAVGDEAQQIAEQDEHEEREDEGEVRHPLLARRSVSTMSAMNS